MIYSQLSEDAIEQEVQRLATEFPATIYENSGGSGSGSCFYNIGEAGPGVGCIFGQALKNLGVPEETLDKWEGRSIETLWRKLTDREAPLVWTAVQDAQDNKAPWGEAINQLH